MEFQRFVSYVYDYQKNQKGENCGFVKAEVRQRRVRFLIHMYLPGKQNVAYQIYGCRRREGELEGILLGRGTVRFGNVDVRLLLPEDDMTAFYRQEGEEKREKIGFDELCGVLIRSSEGELYATVWDEEELDVTSFREWTPKGHKEEGQYEKVRKKEAQHTEKTSEDLIKEEKTTGQLKAQEIDENVYWVRIQEECEAMAPFQEKESALFFRMQPRQLELLPRHFWQLGRNSFLMHGYYNYRYFIVGLDGEKIIIGVPGTYSFMEEACAALFGFLSFVPAKGAHKEQGRFGYWCRRMPLEG